MAPAAAAIAANRAETLRKWRRSQLNSDWMRLSDSCERSRSSRSSSFGVRLIPMGASLARGHELRERLEPIEVLAGERLQKLGEIGFFVAGQSERPHSPVDPRIRVSSAVVELDHLEQCLLASVMHVRSGEREVAKLGRLKRPDVLSLVRHQEAAELVNPLLVGELRQSLGVPLDLPSELVEVHSLRGNSDVVILLVGEKRERAHVAVASVATRFAVEERPSALRGLGDGSLVSCQEPIDWGLNVEERSLEARDRLHHPLDGYPGITEGLLKERAVLGEPLQLGLYCGVVGHRHLDRIHDGLQRLVLKCGCASVPKLLS